MHTIIVFLYLIITIIIGVIFHNQWKNSQSEYYLAGRKLTPLLLFFSLAATNFSAFTIFGLSGIGYRIGYAFYPIMGFGTGLMALSFYFIGSRMMVLSRERDYITPADYVEDRYKSQPLKILFSTILIIFTLPYIAIQIMAGGKSIYMITGIPYVISALILTLSVSTYVILGGLRSIAWTDVLQGIMMIIFSIAAFIIISSSAGGFTHIMHSINKISPAHLTRPGNNGIVDPWYWSGFMLLWFFANPMFPQLFQRFMASKDDRALKTSMILYPLITTFLFFITLSIGVMGRYLLPDLSKEQSDVIFTLLLQKYASPLVSTVIITGSLAAIMSTMDSQLLTVSSMIHRDLRKTREQKKTSPWLILTISAISYLIALYQPSTLLVFIKKTTFNGLAALSPVILGGLYWKKGSSFGALLSIISGEAMVLFIFSGIISFPHLPDFLIIVPTAFLTYILGSLAYPHNGKTPLLFSPGISPAWSGLFAIIIIMAHDFWNWDNAPGLVLGFPYLVVRYMVMGILLSIIYFLFLRKKSFQSFQK